MNHRHRLVSLSLILLTAFLTLIACREQSGARDLKLFDLNNRKTVSGPHAIDAIADRRLVLVGEHHNNPSHHLAQLHVIRSLAKDKPVAIGLEMFRKSQQDVLDRWVAGGIDEGDFIEGYLDNWNFPWPLYRDIFLYARDNSVPLVGLNVKKEITRQVSRKGFASLSDKQRGELEGVTCNVTREYRDFIRSAFGAHGHGQMDFVYFCEAQLVWDTAMAVNAINYLERHPDRIMVLLAGSGHARKMGIPYQVKNRTSLPIAVLLPHTPEIFEPETLTSADADYIIMP